MNRSDRAVSPLPTFVDALTQVIGGSIIQGQDLRARLGAAESPFLRDVGVSLLESAQQQTGRFDIEGTLSLVIDVAGRAVGKEDLPQLVASLTVDAHGEPG